MKRSYIGMRTKLAAALCQMVKPDGKGGWEKIIPHDTAKHLTEGEILSMFEWDHWPIQKAIDGPDAHWNLRPLLCAEHATKTATIDTPQAAKTKRISAAHEAFRNRLLAKINPETVPENKPKRKMLSRPFAKRQKQLAGV